MAAPSDARVEEAVAEAAPAAAPTDAKKPKRALSAYWIYSSSVREEVTKESKEKNNGKAGLGDIAKIIAGRWAAMPEAEKKPFEDKAEEDKRRYEAEMQAFNEASDPAGLLRKKYEHLIPKRPKTGYFLFMQDAAKREKATESLKAEGSEANMKQLTARLAEMWKAAPAEERAGYEEQSQKERAEFLERQKTWQATPEFAEIEKAEKEMAERRKAAEADAPAEAKGTKRGRKAEGEKTPSPKKAKAEAEAGKPTPAARSAKRAKHSPEAPEPAIDAEVLAEAGKLGFEAPLKNLAGRPEVVASGKQSREILAALKASGGLVNPAKRALLGA